MSGHHHEQKVPRAVLIAAGALILVTIGIAASARSARMAEEEAAPVVAPVEYVDLRFEDREDGSVGVMDAETSRDVAVIPPESNGFIRGVLRGMFRTRKLESIDPHAAFRLERDADGSMVLLDPESGRRVELRSFGRTNYEAFARLLAAGTETP